MLACSKRHPYFFKDQNLEKYLIFKMASQELIDKLKDAATRLRIHSVECTAAAGSGHPTSCSSMAETIACLYFQVMQYVSQFLDQRFLLPHLNADKYSCSC